MKKYLILSAIAAALLFSGCSDETKQKTQEAAASAAKDASKAADEAKVKAASAMEEAKRQASEAIEHLKESGKKASETVKQKTEEAVESAKKMGVEAAESVEKKAAEVKKDLSAQTVAPTKNGAALFAKCAGCHGADGKTKALGKAPAIAGMEASKVAQILHEYKEGKRDVNGMGSLMKGQVASLSDSDIKILADYIASLK